MGGLRVPCDVVCFNETATTEIYTDWHTLSLHDARPISGGGSLNGDEPPTGQWHQFWIGSSPGRVEFIGGPANGAMVLTGYWRDFAGPGQHALVRQTFTAIDSDTVRQHGEASTDQGQTWQTRYDFIYRRKKGPGQ